MITRVRVKNYRSIADVDVRLGPLTVLVGRNGAGKSAFVDVLCFVRDALQHGIDTAIMQRHGILGLRRWSVGQSSSIEIILTVESRKFWGEYALVLSSGQQGDYRVKREAWSAGDKSESIQEYEIRDGKWFRTPGNIPSKGTNALIGDQAHLVLLFEGRFSNYDSQLYSMLTQTNFYDFFPTVLREPQKPFHGTALTSHGENIASVLQPLKQSSFLPDLLSALNLVVGDVTDLRIRQVGSYLVTELAHRTRNGHSVWLELDQESDGTLRLLGILAALYQKGPHVLTAIEEPETSLYPGALGVMSDVLREASKRSQILITTQSPDLISRFAADELRVVERVDGVTQIGPLDETQREVINEQLFSAGDLLRIEGLHRAPVTVTGGEDA